MHACPTRSRLWAGVGSKRGMCEGSSSARPPAGALDARLAHTSGPPGQSFAPALALVPEGAASLGGPSTRTSDGRGLPAPAVRRVPPDPHSLVCCRAPALGVKRASQMTFGTRPLGTSGRRVRRSPASRRDARFRASAVVYRSDGETADGGPAVTTRCSGCGRSPPTGGIERSRDGHAGSPPNRTADRGCCSTGAALGSERSHSLCLRLAKAGGSATRLPTLVDGSGAAGCRVARPRPPREGRMRLPGAFLLVEVLRRALRSDDVRRSVGRDGYPKSLGGEPWQPSLASASRAR